MAKLISEYRDVASMNTFIEEGVNGAKKKYYITGSFLRADERNQNGNLYPFDVVKTCIDTFVTEKVNKNRAIGELNHPHTPEINLERIAVIIEELKFEGNDLMGKARVVHPKIKELIDEGLNFGVSLRALGALDEDQVMQEGMQLIAIDVVADPSFATAFVDPILESKEYNIADDGSIICANECKVVNENSADTEAAFKELFKSLQS